MKQFLAILFILKSNISFIFPYHCTTTLYIHIVSDGCDPAILHIKLGNSTEVFVNILGKLRSRNRQSDYIYSLEKQLNYLETFGKGGTIQVIGIPGTISYHKIVENLAYNR